MFSQPQVMKRLEACLLLQSLPGMGLHRSVKLVSHFGSAEAVFFCSASFKDWVKVKGLGERLCKELTKMEMKGLIRALPGKQFEWI